MTTPREDVPTSFTELGDSIVYRISMVEPERHYFDVTLVLNETSTKHVDLVMPVWAPGAYTIAEFAKNLTSFSASDRQGPLHYSKLKKNVWRVDARGSALRIRYRVYAFERSSSRSYLDAEHAVLNLVNLLMLPKGREYDKVVLVLSPKSYCRTVSTRLVRLARDPLTFVAPNYDSLVDSPIMVGNSTMHTFEAGGKKHEVAIYGGEEIDQDYLVSQLSRIVRAASHVYGDLPYERYVFLIDVDGNVTDDGLEHRDSTYCLVPRLAFTTEQGFKRMLGLFCHEFFHLWNVKRMSPASLVRVDYGEESYTNSLWIAEGITTYYEHLLLRRAGIYTVPEFLDNIADLINRYQSTPGRRSQSAEESSYDAWIKFYRPTENSINTEISYYTIGALLGLALDLEIRRKTRSQKDLDDVMRRIYRDTHGAGRGFTDEEFQKACETVAGSSLEDFFQNHVRGTRDIPFDRYLGYAGLKLLPKSDTRGRGFAGIKLIPSTEKLILDSVLSSSPGMDGSLFPGDEVIGINKIRIDRENLRFLIEHSRPGKTLVFTVNRAGLLRDVSMKLGRRQINQYRAVKKSRANDEEKELFKKWLHQDWSRRFGDSDMKVPPAVDWLFFKPDYF
jgi:predicted metalloprotease with PDZ domain